MTYKKRFYKAQDGFGIVDLLNEQDEKIKELEEKLRHFMLIKNKEQLSKENEALKDTIATVLAQKSNYLKHNLELREENQQLKQSQNSKAIEELQKVKDYLLKEANNSDEISFVEYVIDDYIDNQITELRGGENDNRRKK